MSRHIALLIPFTLVLACALVPCEASATYRYLCTSVPSACTYVPDDNVPVLNADVCFSTSGGIKLKGTANCPSGTWPYFVYHGEVVDPLTGDVDAYIPLDNACEVAGLCVEYVPHTGGSSAPMCCDEEYTCVPELTCGGTLWWCHDGVSEADGTVTCFHAEEL